MAQDAVPAKARKYRNALYVFNFVLIGFGLTCVAMSVSMLRLSSETFFPDWMFQVLLSIAVVVLIIGLLGVCGASSSFDRLQEGKLNFWLIVLTALMSALIVAELVMGVWGIVSFEVVSAPEAATTQSSGATEQFETGLREQLRTEPELWWDWQKTFECCGYDNNTIPSPLATGKYCTTDIVTSASPCKLQFWADISSNTLPFTIFGIVFFAIQLMVCVSSMCLGCCLRNKKE
eukprot:CAMPEP_0202687370 /NCGR_PEP_ID=MMETSP1385-20130828/3069_1 /ASSEMBLY_ACC=CAM_ASM_000861 /TAXON_ID=933848 /ORGANISM="Elphidium margaritaceum" /LENGTH=232 /DNA_ID=CAMNT_0049342151 /DNA_START=53 /DNA_END=751 /DNA_ORIENTATION=+